MGCCTSRVNADPVSTVLVIGPESAGKTTLLRSVGRRCAGADEGAVEEEASKQQKRESILRALQHLLVRKLSAGWNTWVAVAAARREAAAPPPVVATEVEVMGSEEARRRGFRPDEEVLMPLPVWSDSDED